MRPGRETKIVMLRFAPRARRRGVFRSRPVRRERVRGRARLMDGSEIGRGGDPHRPRDPGAQQGRGRGRCRRDRGPRRPPRPAAGAEIPRIEGATVRVGALDITFYRDDIGLRAEAPEVHETRIPSTSPGATVVLVDDVLFTGRTIRAAWTRWSTSAGPRRSSWPCWSTGATGSSRSGRTSSARTCRRARTRTSQVRLTEVDGEDAVVLGRRGRGGTPA